MSEASQAVEQGLSPLTPVSVVIVNYEGRDHLAHTLPAVAALEGVITEVILVDNSSTDGSLELARELSPGITVIEAGGNLGPAAARNLGLEAARNRWVLLLDNDVICPPLTLRVLLAAADDGVALVQPRSVLADAPETVHYDGGSAHCQGLISLDNFYAPLASAGAAVARDVDVVISLVPQTPATDKLIGAKEIALLKPGAAFVNVSRGAVVDTDALVARLEKGDISAGLDVFDPEPVPFDHPITKLPNVFLSPHSASRTRGGGNAMFSLMVDEVSRVLEGHTAQFQLTPAAVANRHGKPPPSKL